MIPPSGGVLRCPEPSGAQGTVRAAPATCDRHPLLGHADVSTIRRGLARNDADNSDSPGRSGPEGDGLWGH